MKAAIARNVLLTSSIVILLVTFFIKKETFTYLKCEFVRKHNWVMILLVFISIAINVMSCLKDEYFLSLHHENKHTTKMFTQFSYNLDQTF